MDDENTNAIRTAIEGKFETLVSMVGQVKRLIVSGPPGIGKTHDIERELGRQKRAVTILRGGLSPIGLYLKLWETRTSEFTLVIDDSDNILSKQEGIDLLKAAFDTHEPRRVQWNKEKTRLAAQGIPTQFEYDGQIIFITNLDFRNAKSKNRQADYDTLISRAFYLDLEMNSPEAKLERCQMALERELLRNHPVAEKGMLFEYLKKFSPYFYEVSLRTLVKLAETKSQFPNWELISAMSLMDNPPPEASKPFTATGTEAAVIVASRSKEFENATLQEIDIEGDYYLFPKKSIARSKNEHAEIKRRIEVIDDFFLETRFLKMAEDKGGTENAVGNSQKFSVAPNFKIPDLSQERSEEIYDFILSHVDEFEAVSVSALRRMLDLYMDSGTQWENSIVTMFTRRGIAYHA